MDRLDVLLSKLHNIPRNYAKELILAGKIEVCGKVITKPGAKISSSDIINATISMPKFVSRGGDKLFYALKHFGIDLSGLNCLDIGATTGGFSDCMLQEGAKSVLAIENGSNQLAQKLLADPRLTSLENTDIRTFELNSLPFVPNFIACDISFISLAKVAPKLGKLLESGALIALIKPQFEVGYENISKNGIVRSENLRQKAVENVKNSFMANGFKILDVTNSPILGKKGNVEYLLYATRGISI